MDDSPDSLFLITSIKVFEDMKLGAVFDENYLIRLSYEVFADCFLLSLSSECSLR